MMRTSQFVLNEAMVYGRREDLARVVALFTFRRMSGERDEFSPKNHFQKCPRFGKCDKRTKMGGSGVDENYTPCLSQMKPDFT